MLRCARCQRDNPEDARFCGRCGEPLAPSAGPHEERKRVTVLFADLVGFSDRAAALDPEDVRRLLTPYHERLRRELERYGGTVEKFIGDAVMAVFGAPAAHEDDPERAVRAAIAIRDGIASENAGLGVRIGITTGDVLVDLGARPALGESMVAGEIVNVAARLQAAAAPMAILVDEATQVATRAAVASARTSDVQGKGMVVPMAAWEIGLVRSTLGVDVGRGPMTSLVGRERERALLSSVAARSLDDRDPSLVTLIGVPGIGKSRLVAELLAELEADPTRLTRWRQGRSLPYGDGVAFWGLGEIVKAEAGILESDGRAEARDKLTASVAGITDDPAEAAWLVGHLERLVGLSSSGEEATGPDAPSAWQRYLEAMAERRPTVLVFEDLHWADDGLLDFLDELVDRVRDVPLLVVAAARPELLDRRPTWSGGKANAVTIRLAPLGESATRDLLGALLADAAIVDAPGLLERVGGNPLFAEQYARALIERGHSGDELPATLHGLIAARIDLLRPDEKTLLQAAAVVGKVFWTGAVAEATGMQREDAETILRALERLEFVTRARRSTVAGEDEYAFRHVLLRDVAYGEIPRASRAERHRSTAAWIEALGRPEDHAELVAHHYRLALEYLRATGGDNGDLVGRYRDSCVAAGRRAAGMAAYDTAARLFGEAVATLTPDDPRRPRVLLELGRARFQSDTSGGDELAQAFDALAVAGDLDGVAEAMVHLAEERLRRADPMAAERVYTAALGLTAAAPESRARAIVVAHHSVSLMTRGAITAAIEESDEALRIADRLGLDAVRARALNSRGTSRVMAGDDGGIRDIEAAVEIAGRTHSYEQLTRAQNNLGSALEILGRLTEARRVVAERRRVVERYGRADERRDLHRLDVYEALGDGRLDDALALLASPSVTAGRGPYVAGLVAAQLAFVLYAKGRSQDAAVEIDRGLTAARAFSDPQAIAPPLIVGSWLAIERGDRALADHLASETLGLQGTWATAGGNRFAAELAWALHDLARTDDLRGLVDSGAGGLWSTVGRAIAGDDPVAAAETLAAMGHRPAEAYTRLRAAEWLAESGRSVDGLTQLELASGALRDMGADGWLTRAEALGTRLAVRPT